MMIDGCLVREAGGLREDGHGGEILILMTWLAGCMAVFPGAGSDG